MPNVQAPTANLVTWPADFPASWSGCPQVPIHEALAPGFELHSHRTALMFDDGFGITNGELRQHVEHLAGYLRSRIAPGDRVILAMGNRAEFVIADLAVIVNRGVVVSVDPEIGEFEADYVVRDSGARLAIVDETSEPVFGQLHWSGHLDEVVVARGAEPHGFARLLDGVSPMPLSESTSEYSDLVGIGYTSGTTGLPKALGGTHCETVRYMDVHLRSRYRDTAGTHRVLYPLQLHYGDPLVALYAAIRGGTSVVIMRRFSASRFWSVAKQFEVTEIVTIGSIPDMLLSRPESPDDRDHNIRSAVALAIPPTRHAELERRFGFPWREAYGSSETGPAIGMPASYAAEFVGTGALGVPYPDMEARLVDPDGEVVEGAGLGELEMRGLIVFEGYLGNSEATNEVLHDGWLRTGDLMRRDERGVYYFAGRRKEIIRRSGINIAPAEIESVLRLHPDVVDAAVVPVADAMMGEEVKAYVELREGSDFDPAGLWEFCSSHLNRQKVPRYFEQRTTPFPRTPTQRIPKNQLKVDGEHSVATAWDRNGSPVVPADS